MGEYTVRCIECERKPTKIQFRRMVRELHSLHRVGMEGLFALGQAYQIYYALTQIKGYIIWMAVIKIRIVLQWGPFNYYYCLNCHIPTNARPFGTNDMGSAEWSQQCCDFCSVFLQE